MKNNPKDLELRMLSRIKRSKWVIVMRCDFSDLGSYSQIGRVLRRLVTKGILIHVGYGLYAKAKKSIFTGNIIPCSPLPDLAREAIHRLGGETVPSRAERDYNSGRSTQVPTGRRIAVKGRFRRKIGYDGTFVSYESAPKD